MTVRVTGAQLAGPRTDGRLKPLLVLGPSLGTSGTALWSACAPSLAAEYHLVAWDLPGHGTNAGSASEPFRFADLAAGVLALVDAVQAERGDRGQAFGYAGDSAGGAVGLQLLLDAPERLTGAVLLCTSARFGAVPGWRERAATVRASGTSAVLGAAAGRWFAPGFLEREPERASALLAALRDAHAEGYAQVCDALAAFDVSGRLDEIEAPVLAIAGGHDLSTPRPHLEQIVSGVRRGRLVLLEDVGHQAPAEAPERVASLMGRHFSSLGSADPYQAGLQVRREVLGDAHVDRAIEGTTDLTRDFQDLITRYAWGTIWTRPGLDRRSRSMITLTALIARGHHEELAMHVRAALRNGLGADEIKEVILQSAVYCGVPDANTAFRIAQRVLDEREGADA